MSQWHQPATHRVEADPATRQVSPPVTAIAPDCRHYRGDRPCVHNQLCTGCKHYEPYSHRVCIIKLGALGDVIRTLCILPELRRLYPAAQITWVSKPNGCRMLSDHPMIDRLLPFDTMMTLTLEQEVFDIVINLDKEPQPCAFANRLQANKKLGMGLSPCGTPVPINAEAHPYFHLGLSDDLKFHQNNKSYPELVYDALGLTYQGQRYELTVNESVRGRIRYHLAAQGWRATQPTLGINVGAGHVFANKMWPAPRVVDVIRLIQGKLPNVQIVLLGGRDERSIINAITARLRTQNALGGVIDSGTEHDESSFVALVEACDVVFCGDTMAMHTAVALGKAVVAFFGPTCEQEIDLFGNGRKLVASVHCGPCYKRECDQDNICIDRVSAQEAFEAIAEMIAPLDTNNRAPRAVPLRVA